jgi:hypothetical protein
MPAAAAHEKERHDIEESLQDRLSDVDPKQKGKTLESPKPSGNHDEHDIS